MPSRPTGHDVARRAGVSQATVSRALRNLPGTAPLTREAVLAAATELGYVPLDQGRALSTRRARRVAVVVGELTNPYYPELVEPLRRALGAHGLATVLIDDPADHASLNVQALADGAFDGVVLTTTRRHDRLPGELRQRAVPHVLVNRILDTMPSPGCTFDNAAGSRLIADLLLRHGHRRIGAVHGPAATSTGLERAAALTEAIGAAGLTLPLELTRRAADYRHETGRRQARQILARPDRPTALVCANDVLALGALCAARELGIVIPDQLTVVGFDDIAMSAWPSFDLTTVACDQTALAETGVRLLVDAIGGSPTAAVARIPVHIVERGTHGPPPQR